MIAVLNKDTVVWGSTLSAPFGALFDYPRGYTLGRLCDLVVENNLSEVLFGKLLQTTTWHLP